MLNLNFENVFSADLLDWKILILVFIPVISWNMQIKIYPEIFMAFTIQTQNS